MMNLNVECIVTRRQIIISWLIKRFIPLKLWSLFFKPLYNRKTRKQELLNPNIWYFIKSMKIIADDANVNVLVIVTVTYLSFSPTF